MSDSDTTPAMSQQDQAVEHLVCPFCALSCDDLSLPANRQTDGLACEQAREGFAAALSCGSAHPRVNGQVTDWDNALNEARHRLEAAHLPVFHGLLGDLGDARAAWRMAARYGGIVDHRDGDNVARNLTVYQDSGWITTSLGEARHRADLVVWVGAPNALKTRLFDVPHRLQADAPVRFFDLHERPRERLDHARALLAGRSLPAADPTAGDLLSALRDAAYAVFVFGDLDDERGTAGEAMTLRSASDLVRQLNETQRAALLLIGRGPGDITAQISGAWHTGFGIRTSLARGYPEQDLQRFAAPRLLADGQADLLVWISSLDPAPPPSCTQAQIVFGHPAMQFDDTPPAVFLPVAVPGVHRSGFIHRGDGLRLLPLRAVDASALPGTEQLCRRLLGEQGAKSPC